MQGLATLERVLLSLAAVPQQVARTDEELALRLEEPGLVGLRVEDMARAGGGDRVDLSRCGREPSDVAAHGREDQSLDHMRPTVEPASTDLFVGHFTLQWSWIDGYINLYYDFLRGFCQSSKDFACYDATYYFLQSFARCFVETFYVTYHLQM